MPCSWGEVQISSYIELVVTIPPDTVHSSPADFALAVALTWDETGSLLANSMSEVERS